LGENANNIRKNTEVVLIDSKEAELELSAKHLFVSYYHSAGQNRTTKVVNKLF
jgi:hypothetical protein